MVNKTSLLKSNEIHIKDGLNLYIPTVGEVLHNEQGYYSLATSLTSKNVGSSQTNYGKNSGAI